MYQRPTASLNVPETTASLKAGDPGFLEKFFSKSRLHHLSSAGNDFKSYIQELREKSTEPFHGLESLRDYVIQNELQCDQKTDSRNGKRIMHIDMDCFFVSVGLLKRPHLINKPVVVTHAKTARGVTGTSDMNVEYERNHYNNRFKAISEETIPIGSSITNGSSSTSKITNGSSKSTNGSSKSTNGSSSVSSTNVYNSRSEIACASYEARSFGIKNGSYLGPAKQLCPGLIEIPYDFDEYERVSKILYDTIASFTLEIEAVSCDEMFVDVTKVLDEANCSADTLATFLRNLIREKSGL